MFYSLLLWSGFINELRNSSIAGSKQKAEYPLVHVVANLIMMIRELHYSAPYLI